MSAAPSIAFEPSYAVCINRFVGRSPQIRKALVGQKLVKHRCDLTASLIQKKTACSCSLIQTVYLLCTGTRHGRRDRESGEQA